MSDLVILVPHLLPGRCENSMPWRIQGKSLLCRGPRGSSPQRALVGLESLLCVRSQRAEAMGTLGAAMGDRMIP